MRSLAPSHDPLAFHLATWNLQQHKQAKDNTVHTVRKSYTELALGLHFVKEPIFQFFNCNDKSGKGWVGFFVVFFFKIPVQFEDDIVCLKA
jgi:hypothetical protein